MARIPSGLIVAFAIMAFAGALRFYKLGDWPFAGDETATLREEQSLFADGDNRQDSQIYRLPRVIPLSHLFHHISYSLAGSDEFGSRMVMALLGTLSVGLVFLMLDVLHGRVIATATALLVALWPEHIFYSQQARFYIVAAFFSYLCILIGAFAAQRRTTLHCIMLSLSAVAALLSHTLMGVLLPITFAGVIAAAFADRRPLPKNVLLVFLGTAIVVGFFLQFYLRPLLSGWNTDASWKYGVLRSTLASVNMVGWPVVLLGVLGFLLLLHERNAKNWYWITCALGWAAASTVFPFIVAHHPEYVFPLAISGVILAGYAIGAVYEALRSRSVLIAAAWVGLACLGNLPSLASHYIDGSRPDMRTASQYIKKNWQPGDRMAGFSIGLFRRYAPGCEPAISLPWSKPTAILDTLVESEGRLWVAVQSGRSGLPEDLRRWLGTHCSYELKVRRTRFDYGDNCVDVFLYTPATIDRKPSSVRPAQSPEIR